MTVYSAPRQAAPIIKVNVPRARSAPASRRRRSSHRASGGGGGGALKDRMIKVAIGGAAIAFVEKSGMAIPTVPMLGRVGTIAVAAYFLGGKKPGLLQDVALAGATLAGYEFAKDGKISGDDE